MIPSPRTSGHGTENTTVAAACSAAGQKTPRLVVFQAGNVWGKRVPAKDSKYPGTG
jgi:hypothetical protein